MRLQLLALSMIMSAALVGCGNKNNGSGPDLRAPAAPGLPGQVTPSAFSGRPGQFSGVYRGDCVVESQGYKSDSCSIVLAIAQEQGLLDVTMDIRYSFAGQVEKNKRREVYTISGNRIIGRNGREGLIGPEIFTLVSPPSNARQGGMARYTFAKTGQRRLTVTMEANMPQYSVVLHGELRGSRPIPRSRNNSRN